MRGLRWLMIFLCFVVEVRVKAGVKQEPTDCMASAEQTCSLFSFKPTSLRSGSTGFRLSAGTILFRNQQKEWNLVQGTLRVQSAVNVRLVTKVGVVLLAPGVQWLQWRDNKLWVYSLEGGAQVEFSSSLNQSSVIPAGFLNWYGLVDRAGKNSQGVIQPIDPTIARTMLPGFRTHSDFQVALNIESRGIAMAADFYGQVAQQMSENVDEREREARSQKQRQLDEENRIRKMFRDKYFSPVDLGEVESENNN